ncbi:MAG: nickel-dependent lactate racemase [Betaproteobacteria bacterium]|nr:MAG: nickel-dependent lactate racemase [Betaproteobacteria bacterium]
MRIELNYGRGTLPVDLDANWDVSVIRKPTMPVETSPLDAVEAALGNPVGSAALVEEAKGKASACILVCDITRPVPNSQLLPVILRQLLAAGMTRESIRILVATGLHRPNEGEELAELIGDQWVLDNFRVENHFARNDADHVDLGTTTKGTLVKLDRRFVDADLRIVTGLVEPHFMAGYSGGRKVIAPGIAHKETITTFHNARFMSHTKADSCILDGNPLHQEQLEIVNMLGQVLAVNTVLDEHRRMSFVNFGEVVKSHLDAVKFTEDYTVVPISRKYRTVVTSAAGYPLDQTYYQTVKGMVVPTDILEPGGNLIIASECTEGIGSSEYADAQRRLIEKGVDGFFDDISAKDYADIDEWQTQMQLKPMRIGSIHLYTTGLSDEDKRITGVNAVDSLNDTIRRSVEESIADNGDASVAVIPEGPYVVPAYRPTADSDRTERYSEGVTHD